MIKFSNIFKKFFLSTALLWSILASPLSALALDVINLNASELLPKAEIFISPRSGNFTVGSTFEAPIYIDTKGNRINTISLEIKFDPKKLAIVNPSGGKSIFGVWIQTPKYDNTNGTASLAGMIPGGLVTSSGLIVTMTFKAISPGETSVSITDYSSANLDDGLGTDVKLSRSGGFYTLIPKAPDGVEVSSDTHPLQDRWYNNNSPILRWGSLPNTDGFSIALDNSPNTIPPANITTTTSSQAYENLKDGIWYMHVRANVSGVWGNTSHFQIKIDTNPPAKFNPDVNTLKDSSGAKKYLLSFLTTDMLSGIEHYEVGSVDNSSGDVSSPVFIQTESPYLVPSTKSNTVRVLIRAFDSAGNIREAHIDLYPGFTIVSLFKKYSLYLLIFLLLLLLIELMLHYLFGHHILEQMQKAYSIFRKVKDSEELPKIEEKIENKPLE